MLWAHRCLLPCFSNDLKLEAHEFLQEYRLMPWVLHYESFPSEILSGTLGIRTRILSAKRFMQRADQLSLALTQICTLPSDTGQM